MRGKISETMRGQRDALEFLKKTLAALPTGQSRVWVHVSSAGEFLQARPVIEELKAKNPKVQVILTFVSPSGYRWAKDYKNVDVVSYAPLDTKKNIREFLQMMKPKALMLVKFDIWPNMVLEAKKMGVSTFLISATLTENSGRFKNPWARRLFAKIYAHIDHIFCVGEEDRQRFLVTNPKHPDLRVVGDTRVDSVLARQKLASEKELSLHLSKLREGKKYLLVVGSCWPLDEELLVPAWKQFSKSESGSLLILVPHEAKDFYLQKTEAMCRENGLTSLRYSEYLQRDPGDLPESVLIVDRVGLLADLYRIGDGAFIGAGQGGVHNTMEPAAWKLPVTFRPVYQNAPEAIALVKQGIFKPVANDNECYERLQEWVKNSQKAKESGRLAREFLDKSQGATYTCFEALYAQL